MKEIHVDNQAKLCFFKWRIITHAFKNFPTKSSSMDIKVIKKNLLHDDATKQKNSMESRNEKIDLFKTLYEESQKETVHYKELYNELVEENMTLQQNLDIMRADHDHAF